MSTWDERAAAEALRRGRCELWDNSTRRNFRAGAAWQREQLLADDTIERAARAMIAAEYPGIPADEAWAKWARADQDYALKAARVALEAAIGDET